jgi:hypothetical protein
MDVKLNHSTNQGTLYIVQATFWKIPNDVSVFEISTLAFEYWNCF